VRADGKRHGQSDAHVHRVAPHRELARERLDVHEDPSRPFQHRLARRRKLHRPGVALEEFQPQPRLELADLAAERRLRDVQALGRAPEVELLGDRHEVAHLPQVEPGIHSQKVSLQ
jgi:hypothetical protein